MGLPRYPSAKTVLLGTLFCLPVSSYTTQFVDITVYGGFVQPLVRNSCLVNIDIFKWMIISLSIVPHANSGRSGHHVARHVGATSVKTAEALNVTPFH